MNFLFDSKLAPLTNCMGFVDANIEDAFQRYSEWSFAQRRDSGQEVKVLSLSIPFWDLLNLLSPLYYTEKRILFSTTSGWTGYLENTIRTETGRIRRISEKIGCKSIEVGAWPSDNGKKINGWGGGFFSLNEGNNLVKNLMLSLQHKGWEFDNYGDIMPFEEPEKYKEKYARNRFTPEMLDRYLKYFGIDFFNEEFYMPLGGKAYLIEIVRPPYSNEIPRTLDEVRSELKY